MRFEEGMAKLEELVEQLEKGALPLEESFKAYEEAAALAKALDGMLKEHEQRVAVLTKDGEENVRIEVSEG